MDTDDRRADVALVAAVAVLFGGRLAFGSDDAGLTLPLYLAIAVATALSELALRWSRGLGAAVRALVAALAFLTLSVDPTTGWDERNVSYLLPGTLFAGVTLLRAPHRARVEVGRQSSGSPSSGERLAATATTLTAVLVLVAVLVFVLCLLAIGWALSRDPS